MSKVAQYLNEHLQGEVATSDTVRQQFATDGSVLTIVPDMIVYPRSTSDIRKVARFAWQLAEKGHKLSITPRGGGSDQTGAAIGSGMILDLQAYMDSILEVDIKQKLVRVQPGITFKALNEALRLHGLFIPPYPASQAYSTVGGAIANNASGVLSGKYGSTGAWVHQLEIILANGEVIQTGRLKKKDVNRKQGLQTLEGEIYREITNLLKDSDSVLDALAIDVRDNAGYNVVDVMERNGSIDLAPLFIGSQGTLGIISEVILKAELLTDKPLVGAIAFYDHESTTDGLDILRRYDAAIMERIDGRLFNTAMERGHKYQFFTDASEEGNVAAVVYFEFDDKGGRTKKKIGKQIAKYFAKLSAYVSIATDEDSVAAHRELLRAPAIARFSDKNGVSSPGFLDGAFVPSERVEDFTKAISELEKKVHIDLPITCHVAQDVYYVYPQLDFQKVGDRQKVFKLLTEWATAVRDHGGHLIGEAGEGRLKAPFANVALDEDTKRVFKEVKEIFDQYDIMNSGVKQVVEPKQLISLLRTEYDGSDFARYGTAN